MWYFEKEDIIKFIEEHSIFEPNETKCVREIEEGDIICLGRQPCEVIEVSGPFWTTSPFDVDKSARKKLEVIIKGQSIFWPKLEYEDKFLYCQDNRVAVYSGSPDVYEGILINVEGGKMLLADKFRIIDDKIVVDEKVGETKSFNLPDNLAGEKIREYHKKNRRVEYKVASYMGVVWIIGWKVHGIRKPAGVEKPAASNDAHGDKGLGDNSKGLIVRSL